MTKNTRQLLCLCATIASELSDENQGDYLANAGDIPLIDFPGELEFKMVGENMLFYDEGDNDEPEENQVLLTIRKHKKS